MTGQLLIVHINNKETKGFAIEAYYLDTQT